MPFDRDDSDFDEVPPDNLVPKTGRTIGDGTTTADHDTVTSELADTKRLPGGYLYAGGFNGADPDARLDSALSSAQTGASIFLERADYIDDRTVATGLKLVGTASEFGDGTAVSSSATWTLNEGVTLESMEFLGTVVMDGNICRANQITGSATGVTVNADECFITQSRSVAVTFTSGTTDNIADSLVGSSVTDNGSGNVVGDIT